MVDGAATVLFLVLITQRAETVNEHKEIEAVTSSLPYHYATDELVECLIFCVLAFECGQSTVLRSSNARGAASPFACACAGAPFSWYVSIVHTYVLGSSMYRAMLSLSVGYHR